MFLVRESRTLTLYTSTASPEIILPNAYDSIKRGKVYEIAGYSASLLTCLGPADDVKYGLSIRVRRWNNYVPPKTIGTHHDFSAALISLPGSRLKLCLAEVLSFAETKRWDS